MAVVQVVLLFGSETWVMTRRLDKSLENFHHRAVRRMAGMGPKCKRYGTWVYTPIGVELSMVCLEEIGVYISHHQNMVVQYIATRPIMDLCLAAEQKLGMRLSRPCQEKPALDILGIRAGYAEVEGGGLDGGRIFGDGERGRGIWREG